MAIGIYNVNFLAMKDLLKNNCGFTLIELLIALAISGLVLTAIYNIFISNNRIYLKQNELTKIEQNLRAAMNIMTKDIRMAGYNSTNSSKSGIYNTSNSTHIVLNYQNSTHRYYFDSNDKVIRNENNQKISMNIGAVKFSYQNSTDSDCDEIDRVDIYMESYSDKKQLDIPTLDMTKTVVIRNACLD